MSYCINPKCPKRYNLDRLTHCQTCGTQLLVNHRYRLIKPLRDLEKRRPTEIFAVCDRSQVKVLKVLRRPKLVELFQQETRVLQRLKHPGIPKLEPDGYFTISSGQQELHCLVMEYIEGLNLEQWLDHYSYLREKMAFSWLRQLNEILLTLHQNHIVHRDIKPSNIMIKPDGKLILIDFGTVQDMKKIDPLKFNQQGAMEIISPGYSPLEQFNGIVMPQSDFYALGRTFVHLLTGIHPIDLPEDYQTGRLIWRDRARKVSPSLADLLDRLMDPFPTKRPANGQVLKQLLQLMADREQNLASHS